MSKRCWIDFHTHYDRQRPLKNSAENILRIVSVPLAESHLPLEENIFPTLELHPWHGEDFSMLYEETAADKKFIGIGEVGLDRLRGKRELAEQINIFEQTALLAENLNKPLTVHCVKCFSEILELYKRLQWQVPTIIHYFRGNLALAQQLWQHTHFVLSLPPAIYTRHDVLKYLQDNPALLERVVLETDDPHNGDIAAHYRRMAQELALKEEYLQDIMQLNLERIYHAGIF